MYFVAVSCDVLLSGVKRCISENRIRLAGGTVPAAVPPHAGFHAIGFGMRIVCS